MKIFYQIFIFLYPKAALLISAKNNKAKLWLDGRKDIFKKIEIALINNKTPIVWVHCSSLGEFEQGRPLIEHIKKDYPKYKILLTFFSPSGYEVRKNYSQADWIFYLPMDSRKNAEKFLTLVNPSLVLFVKYEFWHYYLQAIKMRNIPLLLVSGAFRINQPFFTWYGGFHRNMLKCFSHLFVQNQSSAILLADIGYKEKTSISGDTRFDRVIEIANSNTHLEKIQDFINKNQVIVAGSTWTEDDEELDHYANTHAEIKFIIVPHAIDEDRIAECSRLYKNSVLFSQISHHKPLASNANVLIIDNVGMLSTLYRYATVCYVGGAFGDDGVHNVLEAAVYEKPVVFGPEFNKYIEATELIDSGGGISIENALELEKVLNELLKENDDYKKACFNAGDYVKRKSGATKTILHYIYENRLLTN